LKSRIYCYYSSNKKSIHKIYHSYDNYISYICRVFTIW